MKKLLGISIILGSIASLSACVPHLTLHQCMAMDWYQVGYNDALQDKSQRDLTKAIQDCSRYKIKVNVAKYKKGWKAGARAFCTPAKGQALGENNKPYNDICPVNQKAAFVKAWHVGLEDFWSSTGYNDGLAGRVKQDLGAAVADTGAFKAKLTQIYSREWRKGTRKYCVPSRAYKLGVNGSNYNHICPADLSRKFAVAWHQGLRKYCVPDTGYNLGRNGNPFPEFCAADQVPAFRNAYDDGNRIFRNIQSVESQISSINSEMGSYSGQISSKQSTIDQLNDNLTSNSTPDGVPLTRADRRDMHIEIRGLRDDIYRLQDQISQDRTQVANLQMQLNDLKSR